MALFLLQRLAVLAATLVVASLVVFGVMEILPGQRGADDARADRDAGDGRGARPQARPRPALPVRYAPGSRGALRGDLGLSYAYDSPIAPLIAARLAVSAPLAAMAMALSAAIALVAGVYAADRRGRAGDAAVMARARSASRFPISGSRSCWCSSSRSAAARSRRRLSRLGRSGPRCRRADPAGDRARPRAGGDPDPRHALGAARGAERRLHPHRARQGRVAPRGAVAPRAAQRDDADPDHHGTAIRQSHRRRDRGRERLRPAGPRPADRAVDRQSRRAGGRGLRDAARVLVIGLNFLVDLACAAIDPRLRSRAA